MKGQRIGGMELSEAKRLRELAASHPRYYHPLLHDLLFAEGLVANRKRSYCL